MSFLKKKINHTVTENTPQNHLEVMRINYHENPVVSKNLPKPLWIRLHKDDPLNLVYINKDIIFQNGQIYYAYIVQANAMLFEKGSKLNLPANVLYSTHPITEKYPQILMSIGKDLYSYKNKPENEIPVEFREMARIITDELDRSKVDFTISLPDPENPDKIIDNIDVHFCSVIVFYKDIPEQVLQGNFLPVLAVPEKSDFILILPKEYWTQSSYSIE